MNWTLRFTRGFAKKGKSFQFKSSGFVFEFCLSTFAWKIVLDCLCLRPWKTEGTMWDFPLSVLSMKASKIAKFTTKSSKSLLKENALTSWIAWQIALRMSWCWDHWNINFILSIGLLTRATLWTSLNLWTTFPSIDMTARLPPSLSLPVNSRQIQSDKQDKANASFTRISSELKVFRRHFPHVASDFAVRGSQNRCNMWHDVTDVAVCQAFVGAPLWPN